ncbi:MAG: hypothetical protein U9Q97_05915 [Acidobacteriota bacterium]|nr:hypothetical protein [Acidobacteriota bacterium]
MGKELHLIDLALAEKSLFQAPIPLSMTALPCLIEEESWVLLMARIPADKIKESIWQKSDIYFLVFDEKDNLMDLKRRAVRTSALKGKEAYYYSLLPVPPGAYKFRIVIRDMDTGRGAVGRCLAEIPHVTEQDFLLFPPLLLAPGKSGLLVQAYKPKAMPKSSLLDYFPFDPEEYSPVLEKMSGNSTKIRAVLHCSLCNLAKALLKFTASLIEKPSGQSTTLPVSILSGNKDEKMGTLLVELQMPDMASGDYILVITAEDIPTQARSQTSVTLKIY